MEIREISEKNSIINYAIMLSRISYIIEKKKTNAGYDLKKSEKKLFDKAEVVLDNLISGAAFTIQNEDSKGISPTFLGLRDFVNSFSIYSELNVSIDKNLLIYLQDIRKTLGDFRANSDSPISPDTLDNLARFFNILSSSMHSSMLANKLNYSDSSPIRLWSRDTIG